MHAVFYVPVATEANICFDHDSKRLQKNFCLKKEKVDTNQSRYKSAPAILELVNITSI